MPKLRNVVTGVVKELPARYVGLYPYELVEESIVVQVSGYVEEARDGDGDGFIQDGTPFEREVDTELTSEEQEDAISDTLKPKKARESSK